MCECGCAIGNDRYRLPGPKGIFYVIEIYPGCASCSAPPGVTVHKITKDHPLREELKTEDWAAPLPFNEFDGQEEIPIKCGLDPDEFRKAAVKQIVDYVACFKGREPRWLDKDDAMGISDELWQEAVHGSVEIIKAEKRRR